MEKLVIFYSKYVYKKSEEQQRECLINMLGCSFYDGCLGCVSVTQHLFGLSIFCWSLMSWGSSLLESLGLMIPVFSQSQ